MRKLVLFFGLILVIKLSAQSSAEKKAFEAYKSYNFSKAIPLLESLVKSEPTNKSAYNYLTNAYLATGDYVNTERVLAEAVKLKDADADMRFNYAQALAANGKYDQASKYMREFSLLNSSDDRARYIKNNPDYLTNLVKQSPAYKVESVPSLNTSGCEFSPALCKDGLVYSTSSNKKTKDIWSGNNYYSLAYAPKNADGSFGASNPLSKSLDTRVHDGPATFSSDCNEMFVTVNDNNSGKCNCSSNKEKISHLSLYSAKKEKDDFGKIEPLPFNSPDYSVGHPSLSADGSKLYFISDMPGGYGQTDIYEVSRSGNSWGKPSNLGKEINTPGRELFPTIAADGTLYFSTDGKIGFGGLDIYSAKRTSGGWAEAKNLGAPVNSAGDDFGVVLNKDGKTGYFSSNRAGGKGCDDIYKLEKLNQMILEVIVYDASTNQEIEKASVDLTNNNKKTTLASLTDEFGKSKYDLEGNNTYKVKAKKEGYLPKEISFKTLEVTNEKQTVKIPLRKEGCLNLEITVTEKGKGVLADADVTVENTTTGKSTAYKTNAQGKTTLCVDENSVYKLTGTKKSDDPKVSYSIATANLNTAGQKSPYTFYQNLELQRFEEGMIIEIPDIYYDLNKYNIRPDAAVQLDKVVAVLQQNPGMEIELRSHTDARGSDASNMTLSQNRAKAAVEYIASRGIASNRMLAAGYGETILKNKCANGVKCTEPEHQQNRRTEFKILKVK